MSVKVAVRVRPFNTREKDLGAQLCIKMEGQTTIITDPKTGNPRDFSFDYSFWSHDGFTEREDGYLLRADDRYADQSIVYHELGEQVLNNAWEGYNCCLFAYGQTGSGKSYSMVGYGANKGIIPVSSEEIFIRIDRNHDSNITYEVMVSMLEIYNEKVQDLLIPVAQRPQGGLKIRESKATGVFVENLSKHPVTSYAEIEKLMEKGNTNRSIGSTQMNATSSRAHTIFTIEFKQILIKGDTKTTKASVINLVDLAGSEKAGQTGATGERLKEGCAINKSLVVLGSVIEALAEMSQKKDKKIVIPYRDSALTRILQTALGGNSKTVMVCALSPATVNYEETLSTLRYADRAKKIKNHAVVNESPEEKIIRELTQENDELKRLIDQAGGIEKLRELREQLEANERFSSAQRVSWQQQREAVHDDFEPEIDRSGPHITNINEDHLLSGKVVYNFDNVPLVVGRKTGNPRPDILISNSSVRPRHCVFDKDEDGNITLEPIDSTCSEYLFVNGNKVLEKMILKHLDRIIIGTNQIYLFKIPGEEADIRENDIDYEFAIEEKSNAQQAEIEKEMPQLPQQLSMPIQTKTAPVPAAEEPRNDAIVNEPGNNSIPENHDEINHKNHPENSESRENQENPENHESHENHEIQENHENHENHQPEHAHVESVHEPEPVSKKRQLHSRLAKLFPLVNEANLIATDLNRHVKFNVKIINILPDEVEKEEDLEPDYWEKELKVEVQNQDYGLIWLWDVEKFEDRLCMLREMLDEQTDPSPEEDPLWDPPEENLLGKGYYSLKPLGLLFDNPFNILIISTSGGDAGLLKMNIVPTDEDGQMLDEGPESPEELIGSLVNFRVEIQEAWNIPLSHANNVYCEYHFPGLGIRRTNVFPGYSEHPSFSYKEQFTSVLVDDFLCNYMQTKKLAISVFGTGMAMKVETQKPAKKKPTYESAPAQTPCVENVMENRNRATTVGITNNVSQAMTSPKMPTKNIKGGKEKVVKEKAGKDKEKCAIY